jgi:hypothetical protein
MGLPVPVLNPKHDNENTTLLEEYYFREMTVNLETIGEEYH